MVRSPNEDRILVAVGVLVQSNQVLMAQRQAHQHQAHSWEFPGGKVEPGESVIDALRRELQEEIGIQVLKTSPLIETAFDYPDKKVHLSVHLVQTYEGEPVGRENQTLQWVNLHELSQLKVPLANETIVDSLVKMAS